MLQLVGKSRILSALILLLFFNTVYVSNAAISRPEWIVDEGDLPKGWEIGSDIEIDDRYFLSVLPQEGTIFSIETLTFENSSAAREYVEMEYQGWQDENQLEYAFYDSKVNLSVADTGIVWEVKSSCCYSRGVLFSIEEIYIYIFGSQQATWDEVKQIYSAETIKLLSYLDKDVPPSLLDDLRGNNSSSIPGYTGPSVFLILLTAGAVIRKKKDLRS